MIFYDFKILCSHYNEIVHYWNSIKTLVILQNSTIYVNISNVENYFNSKNKDVLNLVNTRIKSYTKISQLYEIILNPDSSEDLLKADFCDGHIKCHQL